jgi:hypothetical protein
VTGQTWFGVTVAVEVAWGADLTADPSTWVWTDITTDVYQDPGVSWSWGRNDEASTSQPASFEATLRNTSGAYSLGPQASNYPNVRRGTPVRFRVNPDGAGFVTAWEGFAVGFTPSWDGTGNIATVELSAAGSLRRLAQGSSPVQSPLRRSLSSSTTTEGVVAYWPCEEGADARYFTSGLDGKPIMQWTGDPDLASNTTFLGSEPLPVLRGSYWIGHITPVASTGELQVRALVEFPQGDTTEARGVIWSLVNSGTAYRWELEYIPGSSGLLNIVCYNSVGTKLAESGGFSADINLDSRARRQSVELVQNGSNVDVTHNSIDALGETRTYTFTVNSVTIGYALVLAVNGAGQSNAVGALDQVCVGHVTVQSAVTAAADALDEMRGYADEYVDTRVDRLCTENDEPVMVTGTSYSRMGPQSRGTLLGLLRECEDVDRGILCDGHDAGLSYRCREEFENLGPALTLDAASGQLSAPFDPTDDDQRTVNIATVTRTKGVTATVTDETGEMGTDAIGAYERSETINVNADARALDYAGWFVHQGTQPVYRLPALGVDLRRNPSLARDWLGLHPGYRVDLTNLDTVFTGYPTGTVSLFVEGMSQKLGANRWTGTLKCSPYDAWRVGMLGSGVASPISFVGAGTAAAASSGTVTPTLPSPLQAGDLLLVFASTRNSGTGTVDTPSGYTSLVSSGNVSVFGKIAGTAEADPAISFTAGSANETTIAQACAFRGTHQDIDSVLLNSATQLNSSAANVGYPALTVASNNCAVVVAGWKQDDWTSVATLSGLSEIEEKFSTAGNDAAQVWDYVIQSTAANISASSFTVTGGTSQISRGLTFALKPNPEPNLTTERLETSGSTLTSDIAAGATSMSVTTSAALRGIGFKGYSAFQTGDNASLTPTLPTTWSPGDMGFIIAAIRNSGTGTVTTPTGWTALVTSGNVKVLGRVLQSGDTAPAVTFASGAAGDTTMAQSFIFSGLHPDTAAVVLNSAAQLNGSAQNIARPALTVASDNQLILLVWWKQDDSTTVTNDISADDGPTNGSTTTGNDASLGADYLMQGTASSFSSGTLTVTGGASAISRCIMIALSPAVGPVWTTTTADYPMDLDVGGSKVTATACTDTTSPQTFTITAAPLARSAGAAVKLWKPPVLGLT